MKRKIIIIEEDDGQPGIGVSPYEGLLSTDFYDVHPCTYCNNNPKNNPAASGICCCALPDMWNSRPHGRKVPYTTSWATTTCTFDTVDLNKK